MFEWVALLLLFHIQAPCRKRFKNEFFVTFFGLIVWKNVLDWPKTNAHIENTGFMGCGTAILRKWFPTFRNVVPSLSSRVQGQEEWILRNSCLRHSNRGVINFCQYDDAIGDVKSESSFPVQLVMDHFYQYNVICFQEIISPVRLVRTTSLEGRTCTPRLIPDLN
jgi:hypothetical protein